MLGAMAPREEELQGSVEKLATQLLQVGPGEEVLIYYDDASDPAVVEAAAGACRAAGGSVTVLRYWIEGPVGSEPPQPVAAAMAAADVMLEFAGKYLITTKAFEAAIAKGARQLTLTGMDADMLVRTVGRVNLEALEAMAGALGDVTRRSRGIEVLTGQDARLRAEIDASRPFFLDTGKCTRPGQEATLGGQVSWASPEETIEGTLQVDGSVWPPDDVGVLREPITLTVEGGRIVDIEGGVQAQALRRYLTSFADERMVRVAHFCYGFNPGARLSGRILEDERVFGCFVVGMGSQAASFRGRWGHASGHLDGVTLRPTIRLGGEVLEEAGRFVHPAVRPHADRLRPSNG